MGRIRKLSDELANQIAAGEVVERPASVVKELVENAIDAGATRIDVAIEQGGTGLIRVADDGEGMSLEDATMCLERHATSKITAVEDLFRIGTFGFRGEALPSIASVSNLSITTRARDADEAVTVATSGGSTPTVKPAGGSVGTVVEIRDLFFNVPARRKFLKATATESAHVTEVILGVALARPDITVVLTRDGRIVREFLRTTSRAERARAAFGGETLTECKGSRWAVEIEALLGPPERARAGASGLSLLVNGRPIRDRQLARAVAQAYGSVLEGGRYPLGAVWIDLPPDVVDVNVHPQKAEVRFADAREVFDTVTRELHGALARAFGLPALPANPYANARPLSSAVAGLGGSFGGFGGGLGATKPLPEGNLFRNGNENVEATLPLGDVASSTYEGAPGLFSAGGLFREEGMYARLRFVGQVRATYLVCEGDDGVYVLDQHAAAERVTFHRLKKAYESKRVAMQKLLVPEIVELSPTEVALLEEHADEVRALGVETRAVGESAVAVHGVPDLVASASPAQLVRDLTAELGRVAGREFGRAVDLVLATMACHGSVRAGDALGRVEAEALLKALDTVDFHGHCPHGRPLVMRMPWSELDRSVGR